MHILLKNSDIENEKGILIFTHNETSIVLNKMLHLKEKYFFIQHVQFNIPKIIRNKFISVNLMPKFNKVKNNDIPIATNCLIDKCFNPKYSANDFHKLKLLLSKHNIRTDWFITEKNKPIDFIYVGRCNSLKKTIDVLSYFEFLASKGAKCLFLILDQKKAAITYRLKFIQLYNNLSEKIKENIILIDTCDLTIDNNPEFLGFNLKDVSLFYKNSKIYIHAAENEGGSRSIHEAICCGCLIAVKSNMKGGGLDNLPPQHILYNNSNYKTQLIKALNTEYKFDPECLKKISSIYTVPKLLGLLHSKLKYKCNLEHFISKCNTELIQLQMAAHYLTVPWYSKGELTSTIRTQKQIDIFLQELNKKSPIITKNDIYNSKYYKKSLIIHNNVLENTPYKNMNSVKLWSHLNSHILSCLKLMIPGLKNYVEIGSHYGISFCGVLNSKHYENHTFIAIDPNQNMSNYEKTEKTGHDILNHNIKLFNKNNSYHILEGYSYEKKILNKLGSIIDAIDLLYIDGDHSYEGVCADFENYFPLVRKYGFIVFDDYLPSTRNSCKAVNDIVKKYKNKLNVIGILEDRAGANNIKPSCYIKKKQIPFEGANKKINYNMSFIIQKI